MTRPVVFTGDIFRQQPRGGISRYVVEVTRRLQRPASVVMGVHQSELAGELCVPARAAWRAPAVRGVHRLSAPANAIVDACLLGARGKAIVHTSYYRDPRGLPATAPVVVTVYDMTHERLPNMFPPRGRLAHEPERHKRALCARADLALCISESTARDLVELAGVPARKVRVVPLASRDWTGVPAIPVPGVRAPFVLWVGERHAYKNFANLLAAWAGSAEAAGTTLLCAGGGGFRPHECDAVAPHAARVVQRNCTDGELRWAYERAAALVYVSLWEGFGLPLLEGFALGCPALASDRAPFREVAADAAVFAEPTDVDALRAGLRAVLAQDRCAQAVAARRAQAARYSWDTCAALHEAAYRELE